MSSIERPNCYTAEEWKKVKGQFNTDFKRYNDHIKSFNTLINEILDGETEGTFAQKTGLSNNMFSRIRNYVNKKANCPRLHGKGGHSEFTLSCRHNALTQKS